MHFKGFLRNAYRVDPQTGGAQFLAVLQAEGRNWPPSAWVLGASWNGSGACLHAHQRARHFLDERIRRFWRTTPRYPASFSTCRRVGAVHGYADSDAAGRTSCLCAYAFARRHAARAVVPCESRRVFSTLAVQAFDIAERLQTPVFVMSDLDIGNERLDVPGSSMGRCLPAGSRQDAVGGGNSRDWRSSIATWDRDDDAHHVNRTLPGSSPKGRILHAAARATINTADIPKTPPNTRPVSRSAEAKNSRTRRKYLPKPVTITAKGGNDVRGS